MHSRLAVSSSGNYDWQKWHLRPGPRAVEDQALAQETDLIHTRSRKTYGAPRVAQELRIKGRRHGRNRVARLMMGKGLCGRQEGEQRRSVGFVLAQSKLISSNSATDARKMRPVNRHFDCSAFPPSATENRADKAP